MLLVWFAVGGLTMLGLGLLAMTYQLAKQQGRLLLRIDGLENQLRSGVPPASRGAPNGHGPSPVAGLPIGSALPNFTLADVDGRRVALDDFKGQRILLIHWSPSCGFCEQIAPELAALQGELSGKPAQAVLLSYGDAQTNRAMVERHGLRLPTLLLDGRRIDAFDQLGTPVAYLLDGEGNTMAPLAVGAEPVLALARDAIGRSRKRLPGEKPLTESLVLRDGLKPGTPAPRFTLPDLDGQPISLDTYRGRRLLLVFSDPQCGPCNELAPQLAAIDRAHRNNGLAVVMVGRGDREENRRKAREQHLGFPLVVQEQWKLSREYGIFATPVAFLINSDGAIERPVAKGKDEILMLAQYASEANKERV